ncbi:MAG: hypothetical protein ABC596_05790 [Candidatus Methanosuratincola petrocarbonis]
MRFRKKPVIIEAVQLRRDNWPEVCKFVDVGTLREGKPQIVLDGGEAVGLIIPTLEGTYYASEGDWIIRGIKGELYPCKPDVFEATYEPVKEEEDEIES